MLSKSGNNEILAASGEGNDPNAPVFGALDPADQAPRDEAIDSDTDRAWGQSDHWAYRIDGQRPFAQQEFEHAEIREAESGLFNTGGCVPCQGAHRLHHYYPDVIRPLIASGHKNLNLTEVYSINYIDINIHDANAMVADPKGEPGYENHFRNRPISCGRDLSCDGAERLPELHSTSPASGCCWSVHGCPLCLALPVGDLRVSGHRRCTSASQPLRTVGGGNAGTSDCQHHYFPRLDGPERASVGPLCGPTVGRDLHRCATRLFRVVPVAVATAGLIAGLTARERKQNMAQKLTVVVTGSTGKQGGAVARGLLERGHKVRAVTRDPNSSQAKLLADAGATLVAASLEDSAAIKKALEGAASLFAMTVPSVGTDAETRQGIAAADAAKAAGVHLVFTSVGSANRQTGIPHFDSKYEVEKHIAKVGVRATILAPVAFMENLYFIKEQLAKGRSRRQGRSRKLP